LEWRKRVVVTTNHFETGLRVRSIGGMYLRRCYRSKDGKRRAYWALVQSHRTARGPRQRVVAWLGAMDEQGRLGVERCARHQQAEQSGLFGQAAAEWIEVDLKRIRVERKRDFGGPWLGLELIRRLHLDRLLTEHLPPGREQVPWPLMGPGVDAGPALRSVERVRGG